MRRPAAGRMTSSPVYALQQCDVPLGILTRMFIRFHENHFPNYQILVKACLGLCVGLCVGVLAHHFPMDECGGKLKLHLQGRDSNHHQNKGRWWRLRPIRSDYSSSSSSAAHFRSQKIVCFNGSRSKFRLKAVFSALVRRCTPEKRTRQMLAPWNDLGSTF